MVWIFIEWVLVKVIDLNLTHKKKTPPNSPFHRKNLLEGD